MVSDLPENATAEQLERQADQQRVDAELETLHLLSAMHKDDFATFSELMHSSNDLMATVTVMSALTLLLFDGNGGTEQKLNGMLEAATRRKLTLLEQELRASGCFPES